MGSIQDYGMPFTSIAADRQYSSQDWREYFKALLDGGIIGNKLNELQVQEQAVPNKSVLIDTGAIFIEGVIKINETTETVNLTDNVSGDDRIDRIVARLDLTNRYIELDVIEGTPSATPAAPTLTRTATIYEMSLAQVYLANGYSTITNTEITDERENVSVCGYFRYTAKPAWYPGGDIPIDLWKYTLWKNELTAQEISDIEGNQTLIDILFARSQPRLESYMFWVSNISSTANDAAFGKLNDYVNEIGNQMAMYAWNKGVDSGAYPLVKMRFCDTLDEVLADPDCVYDILQNQSIFETLFSSSAYAVAKYNAAWTQEDGVFAQVLARMLGVSGYSSYTTYTAFFNSEDVVYAIANLSNSSTLQNNIQDRLLTNASNYLWLQGIIDTATASSYFNVTSYPFSASSPVTFESDIDGICIPTQVTISGTFDMCALQVFSTQGASRNINTSMNNTIYLETIKGGWLRNYTSKMVDTNGDRANLSGNYAKITLV